MVGPDRQLAVATIHQYGQPDRPRPAEVAQRIQGSPHRTPGVEHVVHEHDDPVVHRPGHLGVTHGAGRLPAQVVAVHGHIERADRDRGALHLRHRRGQPMGQGDAPGRDAEQDQSLGATVRLQDLMRHPGAGPGDLVGVEDQAAGIG